MTDLRERTLSCRICIGRLNATFKQNKRSVEKKKSVREKCMLGERAEGANFNEGE